FEQIGIRAVGELQVDRKRSVQVGQYFTDDGDEIVRGCAMAFSGQLLELLLRDQDGFPSGNQRWRYRRRQRATIATSGERKKGNAWSSEWAPRNSTARSCRGVHLQQAQMLAAATIWLSNNAVPAGTCAYSRPALESEEPEYRPHVLLKQIARPVASAHTGDCHAAVIVDPENGSP